MSNDLLELYLRERRELRPPAARAELKAEILREFQVANARADARRPAQRILYITILAAAAAVIAGLCLLLPDGGRGLNFKNNGEAAIAQAAAPDSPEKLISELMYLKARAIAARRTFADREPRIVKSPPKVEIVKNNFPRTIRAAAALTSQSEATVSRLVAARLLESVDKAAAIERYRELLNDFPGGPACGVAENRIKTLTP